MSESLVVKIGADIKGLQSAMAQASKSIQDAGKKMSDVGKTLSTRLTAPLLALGAVSLKQAADFETLRVSMDTLNGSVEEGARNFERLKEFSAATPFQLGDLAKAQNMLQGFGLSADDAFDSISMIGDIAAISGGSIDGIGIAFGQAAAEGRLMTQDVRQLINQGVPAIKLLADTMGVAESEILGLASEGKISFEILQESFRNATSEGGMFANGMERQSQTIAGLFSTLKDNVSIALGDLGTAISEAFNMKEAIPALIKRIQQVSEYFQSLSKDARKNIVLITAAIAGIGPALIAIGVTVTALGTTIALLTSPITLVVGAIAGLGVAILYLRDNWDAVVERISDIGWWKNTLISMAQFVLEWTGPSLMIKGWNAVITYISDTSWFQDMLINMAKSAASTFDWLDIFDDAIAKLDKFKSDGFDLNLPEIPNPYEGISESLEKLKVETNDFKHEFGSLSDAFINAIEEFTGMNIRGMFTPIIEEINETEDAVKTKMPIIKDVIIDNMDKIDMLLNGMDISIPEKLFPTGSLGRMQQDIQYFRNQLQSATDPEKIKDLKNNIADLELAMTGFTQGGVFAMQIANAFTSSFGSGMANVIVQGEKLVDTLKNIGKLLLSSAIQKGLSVLLTGGLGGGGFFGSGGGLFGKLKEIFVDDALITSSGSVVKFNSADDILASKNMDKVIGGGGGGRVEVFGKLVGQDIFISSNRGSKTYGR